MNTLGHNLTLTTFGESHGPAIGGVLDGFPAGITVDTDFIALQMQRRRPGQSTVTTGRQEKDQVEFLSGLLDGVSTGAPIAFIIRNQDQHSSDYDELKDLFRPSHADYAWEQRYGIRDWRGGGRASARETAARVVAGCIAKQQLVAKGVRIQAELIQVGAEKDPARFAETIARYQQEGDSIGGIIECRINGLPVGTGEPIFDKLQAHLAFAMMSINACKGFEYGTGFGGVTEPGSAINGISGGIAGGIADGSEIVFRCVFKPTPSTPKAGVKGRHDACVAVRAVPVVEAMTALSLVQFL